VKNFSLLRTLDTENRTPAPEGVELPAPAARPLAPAPRAEPRPEPTPPPPARQAKEPAADACPRCGKPLIDPSGLGWCKGCGYCHSLEQDKARAPAAAGAPTGRRKPSALGLTELYEQVTVLPVWFWVLLGGVVAIVGGSFVPATLLPKTGLMRALWATAQLAAGLVLILAAQIWSLIMLAPDDEKLGNKDAILSARLWLLTCQRLPRTCRQVWLGTWGLAAILAAVFVIGGLSHWLNYLPRSDAKGPTVKSVW
jgi:hypothetical protein